MSYKALRQWKELLRRRGAPRGQPQGSAWQEQPRIPPGVSPHLAIRYDEKRHRFYCVTVKSGEWAPKVAMRGNVPDVKVSRSDMPIITPKWLKDQPEITDFPLWGERFKGIPSAEGDEELAEDLEDLQEWWRAGWEYWHTMVDDMGQKDIPRRLPDIREAYERLSRLCAITRLLASHIKTEEYLPRDIILARRRDDLAVITKMPAARQAFAFYHPESHSVVYSPEASWRLLVAMVIPPQRFFAEHKDYTVYMLAHELMHGGHRDVIASTPATFINDPESVRAAEMAFGDVFSEEVRLYREGGWEREWRTHELITGLVSILHSSLMMSEGIADLGGRLMVRFFNTWLNTPELDTFSPLHYRKKSDAILAILAWAPRDKERVAEVILDAMRDEPTLFMPRVLRGLMKVYGLSDEDLRIVLGSARLMRYVTSATHTISIAEEGVPSAGECARRLVEFLYRAGEVKRAEGKLTVEHCEDIIDEVVRAGPKRVEQHHLREAFDTLFGVYAKRVTQGGERDER